MSRYEGEKITGCSGLIADTKDPVRKRQKLIERRDHLVKEIGILDDRKWIIEQEIHALERRVI